MLPAAAPEKIPPALIRIQGLRCGYSGSEVLKGIDLSINPGEFVGILGPNGAGKSTLVMALSGVAQVQGGSIELGGASLSRLKAKERARLMAVVAQDTEVRFPFSCREVVRMGRYPHQRRWRMDSAADAEAVERALEITDTGALAERLVTAISGGERQRVMMARALAQETPILVLDEATSAMDVHRKLELFRVLDQLNRESALTILSVLHDVNLAALFCRRLVFLKDGLVLADGATESVLCSDVLERVYETKVIVQDVPGTMKRQVVFMP